MSLSSLPGNRLHGGVVRFLTGRFLAPRVLSGLGLTLLLVVSTAAQAQLADFTKAFEPGAPWKGEQGYRNGSRVWCYVSPPTLSEPSLGLGAFSDGRLVMMLNSRRWRLRIGSIYTVLLDFGEVVREVNLRADRESVSGQIDGDILREFMRAPKTSIITTSEKFEFDLTGGNEAIAALLQCARSQSSREIPSGASLS